MAKGGYIPPHYMITLTVEEGDRLRTVLEDLHALDHSDSLIIRDEAGEREFHLNEAEGEVVEDLIERLERRDGDEEESLVT